ncbi:MAG: type II toxin-antitoxin system RelE/ParE family toxin [Proteobacteria bacterium]|nr:type II toxin-antitoxin system RelE/ParE family toxin [Pseudomonadota bacterium]
MWKVEYKKRFLKELSKLPEEVQAHAETVVFKDLICENPFNLGYLEQMKGYPRKYKIRIGEYRIGINVDNQNKLIVCSRIAHRKDIYRLFP